MFSFLVTGMSDTEYAPNSICSHFCEVNQARKKDKIASKGVVDIKKKRRTEEFYALQIYKTVKRLYLSCALLQLRRKLK